jgi:hypothetical protein
MNIAMSQLLKFSSRNMSNSFPAALTVYAGVYASKK